MKLRGFFQMIDLSRLTNITREALSRSGWTESRAISIDEDRQTLVEEGFQFNLHAASFLRSFGGLTCETESGSPILFDPKEVVGAFDAEEDGDSFQAMLGSTACPIGIGNALLMFLLDDGRMLLLNDQWQGYWILPSICDGLNELLNAYAVGSQPQEIPREFVPECYR